MNLKKYEKDLESFPDEAYSVSRYPGVAFYVLGWETEPTEETEWSGLEERTGKVLAVMVGDNYKHRLAPEDLEPISREDYCGSCGQIGCAHDGLDREEVA